MKQPATKEDASKIIQIVEKKLEEKDAAGRWNSLWRSLGHCRSEFGCGNYNQAYREAKVLLKKINKWQENADEYQALAHFIIKGKKKEE